MNVGEEPGAKYALSKGGHSVTCSTSIPGVPYTWKASTLHVSSELLLREAAVPLLLLLGLGGDANLCSSAVTPGESSLISFISGVP